MAGDILGGALIGGIAGGLVAGLYALVMKMRGKPIGAGQTKVSPPGNRAFLKPTWQTETKRVLLGIVWFFVLWFLARVILGGIVGASAGAHASGTPSYSNGYNAGQVAALQFFQQYGLLVMLGAFAAAVAGTLTGFLPGTRRPSVLVPEEPSRPAGQWPPPPNFPRSE